MKVWVKVYRSGNTTLVAACDENLLGKKLKFGNTILEIGEFYHGELVEVEEALKLIEEADTANLFGRAIVEACIEKGIVSKEGVLEIEGTPHAQIYSIY